MTKIEIGNSGVFLHELSPHLNPKYSPNLYNWLRRNSDVLHVVYVATDPDGTMQLCMGESDEDWPFTCPLMGVLCNGSKAKFCAVAGMQRGRLVIEDDSFWQRYKEIGRCTIDPEHETSFYDSDRWKYSGDRKTRTCKWCGKVKQRLVLKERIVIDEKWEAIER